VPVKTPGADRQKRRLTFPIATAQRHCFPVVLKVVMVQLSTIATKAKYGRVVVSAVTMTTLMVVTLCVTYEEWYIRLDNNRIDPFIVAKIPSKAILLQSQKPRFFKDKVDRHVISFKRYVGQIKLGCTAASL
jgi:hypothetical protein